MLLSCTEKDQKVERECSWCGLPLDSKNTKVKEMDDLDLEKTFYYFHDGVDSPNCFDNFSRWIIKGKELFPAFLCMEEENNGGENSK